MLMIEIIAIITHVNRLARSPLYATVDDGKYFNQIGLQLNDIETWATTRYPAGSCVPLYVPVEYGSLWVPEGS